MASSIVHLAVTNELTKRLSFTDTNRLKFGAVIVDGGVGGNINGNAHLKVNVLDGKKKTYDFDKFRELFGERMLKDDLYMGYYLHLVQDSLYRHFVYDKYHWNPTIPGNTDRLHKDYSIVNQYIIRQYGLKNDLVVPEGFDHEDLTQISAFDVDHFMKDMERFFQPVEEEEIFFFTKEMSDDYIAEAVEYCVNEVEKLRRGEPGIDMLEFAWTRAGL